MELERAGLGGNNGKSAERMVVKSTNRSRNSSDFALRQPTDQTALTATFCVRSSLGSQKEMLHRRLRTLMAQLGGTVSISGDYPAWEYRQDSSLRDLMTEVFQEQYGRKPKIEAIHAGVECGILSGKLPGLDCVSIGPNLLDIHTPRERMEIASVQRVWRFVLEVLKRSK